MTDYTAEDIVRITDELEEFTEWAEKQAALLYPNHKYITFKYRARDRIVFSYYFGGDDDNELEVPIDELVEGDVEKARLRVEEERRAAEAAKAKRIKAEWDRKVEEAKKIVAQANRGEGPK